jgi:hypothetical protein
VFIQLFDRRHKVLLTQLSGTFAADDIVALYAAAKRIREREGPELRSLQDFSSVTAVDVQIGRIAQHGWRPQVVPGRQRVMVVPQPEYQDIARMFAAYQKIADYDEPQVVRSLDEAYALLNLNAPLFEPIG